MIFSGRDDRVGSVGASPAAPPGCIRQREQVQAGEELQGEHEHRREAQPRTVLPLHHGDAVDDDGYGRSGSGTAKTSANSPTQAESGLEWATGPPSRLLSHLRRPVGRFNAELLGVFGVQSLPAAELHGFRADHAADGSSAEKVIQDIETNVPTGSAHGDEAVTDVGP